MTPSLPSFRFPIYISLPFPLPPFFCLSFYLFPFLPSWPCHLSGPPGPPTSIHVEEITDTTASLSWRPGPDNHSPITAYTIQARTPFSLGWQAVTTGKLSPTSRGLLQSHVGGRSSFSFALWEYWRCNFYPSAKWHAIVPWPLTAVLSDSWEGSWNMDLILMMNLVAKAVIW